MTGGASPQQGTKGLRASLWNRDKLEAYLLMAIVLLGLALRLYRLDAPSMWTDEITGAKKAAGSIASIINAPDSTPDLYHIINHFFLSFGNSDFIVRLPAAIFGVLSIVAIYKVGRLFFDHRVGLIAALVMGVSTYHILYSQEARPYSAFAFFTIVSFYWFWRASESGRRLHWLWYVLATVLNMYTHAFAIFVLGVHGLIMGFFLFSDLRASGGRTWKRTIRKALSSTISALAILMLSVFSYKGIIAAYQFGSRASFGGNQLEFSPDYYLNLLARYGAGNEPLPLLAFLAFLVIGAWSALRHNRKIGVLLLLWLAGPFIVLSFYKTGHFFHIRYVIFTYPPFALLVAAGLAAGLGWLKNQLAARGRLPLTQAPSLFLAMGALAFAGLSVGPLSLYYQMDARLHDYKGIAEYLKANYQPGTLILQEGAYDRQLIAYYLGDQAGRIPIDTVNGDIEEFERRLLSGREVWYITDNPVFDSVVLKYFKQRKVFASPANVKLGRRGLIDWDNSWFMDDLIWRYYPTLYYGLDRDYIYQRLKVAEQDAEARKAQFKAALLHNLLYNGSFEQDGGGNAAPLGWEATPPDLATPTEAGAAFGKRSALLQPKAHGNGIKQRFIAGDNRFADKALTFGVWARSKNPSGNLKLALLNKGTEANVQSPIKIYRNVTDKWRLFTLVTTIRPGYEALEAYIYPDDGSSYLNNDIYLDGAFVVEGDITLLTQNLKYEAFLPEEKVASGEPDVAPVAASPGVAAVEGTSETGYLMPASLVRELEDMSLLANGSFEVSGGDFPLSWVGILGLTKTQQGESPSGQKFLLLTPQAQGNTLYQRFAGPDQAYANKKLTLGVWARTPNGLGNLKLNILDDGTSDNVTNYQKVYYNVDPSWRFYTITTTIGHTYRFLQAYIFPDDGDSFNQLYVDGAVLVEGSFDDAVKEAQRRTELRLAQQPGATEEPTPTPTPKLTPKSASTPTPAPAAIGVKLTLPQESYTLAADTLQRLASKNLVQNGSFELDANGDSRPDGWEFLLLGSGYIWEGDTPASTRSLLLQPKFPGNAIYQTLQRQDSGPGKVSLILKARGSQTSARMRLALLGGEKSAHTILTLQSYTQVTREWVYYGLIAQVPAGYQALALYIYPDDGTTPNDLFVDGVIVAEADLTPLLTAARP